MLCVVQMSNMAQDAATPPSSRACIEKAKAIAREAEKFGKKSEEYKNKMKQIDQIAKDMNALRPVLVKPKLPAGEVC